MIIFGAAAVSFSQLNQRLRNIPWIGYDLQNQPGLFTPWLIFNPICLFVYIVGSLVAVIHHSGQNNGAYIVGHIFSSILVTGKYQLQIVGYL